jgi:hypothetical protein
VFDLWAGIADDPSMDAFIVISFLVLLAILAPRFGVDSRRLY